MLLYHLQPSLMSVGIWVISQHHESLDSVIDMHYNKMENKEQQAREPTQKQHCVAKKHLIWVKSPQIRTKSWNAQFTPKWPCKRPKIKNVISKIIKTFYRFFLCTLVFTLLCIIRLNCCVLLMTFHVHVCLLSMLFLLYIATILDCSSDQTLTDVTQHQVTSVWPFSNWENRTGVNAKGCPGDNQNWRSY